jgi:hypothetical protein
MQDGVVVGLSRVSAFRFQCGLLLLSVNVRAWAKLFASSFHPRAGRHLATKKKKKETGARNALFGANEPARSQPTPGEQLRSFRKARISPAHGSGGERVGTFLNRAAGRLNRPCVVVQQAFFGGARTKKAPMCTSFVLPFCAIKYLPSFQTFNWSDSVPDDEIYYFKNPLNMERVSCF